jgi:hypothetical protein
VAIFIARISRGRTIREFCLGVIVLPTVFSLFWFAPRACPPSRCANWWSRSR